LKQILNKMALTLKTSENIENLFREFRTDLNKTFMNVKEKDGTLELRLKKLETKLIEVENQIKNLKIKMYIATGFVIFASIAFIVICVAASFQPAYPEKWDDINKNQDIQIQNQTQNSNLK